MPGKRPARNPRSQGPDLLLKPVYGPIPGNDKETPHHGI
jgi:hypothetical protein